MLGKKSEGQRNMKGAAPCCSPSAENTRVTVFSDCEGVILLGVTERGKTISSDVYIRMLKIMRKPFQQVWLGKKLCEMLLQHDNTRPHMC